ncbi:hypothetical protein C9I98_18100 [Photobacterium sanctipauli]|uniref:DUF4402 domain-containing protein n=1 Tax=Photobacterium sanctipauli TaxID=1342794 RepID=A0A2T3NP34_9GAMM|nr:hypothetical protein [Photobacterium sanctipauli]PSW18008.1 hypothetical protein C9I98_18100 [Photobacterium sanctipauli]
MRKHLMVLALLLGSSVSGSLLAQERELGEVFIQESKQTQRLEFIGEGNRPVHNTMVDDHSVNQNMNSSDPTEFGTGVKFNATDDFSISVQAGGELNDLDSLDVDSGSVTFELSY